MPNDTVKNVALAGVFAFIADQGREAVSKILSAGADHVKKDFFGGLHSPVDERKDSEILQDMPIMARRVWEGIEYRIQANYGPGFFSQYFGVRNASKRRVEWAAQAVDYNGHLLGALERYYIVQVFLRERRAQIKKTKSKDEALLIAQSKVEAYLYMRGFPMPKGNRFLKHVDEMISETTEKFTSDIGKIRTRFPQGKKIVDYLQTVNENASAWIAEKDKLIEDKRATMPRWKRWLYDNV